MSFKEILYQKEITNVKLKLLVQNLFDFGETVISLLELSSCKFVTNHKQCVKSNKNWNQNPNGEWRARENWVVDVESVRIIKDRHHKSAYCYVCHKANHDVPRLFVIWLKPSHHTEQNAHQEAETMM